MSERDFERMTKLIQRIVASKNFESEEEVRSFVRDHLMGREMEELAAMLLDDEPPSDFDRAESLIDGIPEGTPPEQVVRIAKQALALSEYCMGAWFEYGVYAEDTATALERFEQGIERGRVRFASEIKELSEGHGLWGYIEARDFMRLLAEKAKALEELSDIKGAEEVYKEMLVLNPNDEQGIRSYLLYLLLVQRRLDDARGLLERFPNDSMVAMAYGRAFLEIVVTADKIGYQLPAADSPMAPDSPAAFLKSLGPEFHTAVKLLNQAVKVSPLVAVFMPHGSLLEVQVDDRACIGGPYEAVSYCQRWCTLWFVSGLPFVLLSGVPIGNMKKLIRERHYYEELVDVTDQLEDHTLLAQPPWWQKFSA